MRMMLAVVLLAGVLSLLTPAYPQTGCGCGPDCPCGSGCQCGVLPPPIDPTANGIRRNQADLNAWERKAFIKAVRQLQSTYRPGSEITIYDEYVMMHIMAMMDSDIHDGPVFFPWHRQYLRYFELELQAVNPAVTIPYWDFTVDNDRGSALWALDFMGGNGDDEDYYSVKTGPFRQGEWSPAFDGPDLRRNLGGFFNLNLPTPKDLAQGMLVPRYDCKPFDSSSPVHRSFRNYMTGWNHPTGEAEMHNRVHEWVGGSMMSMASPNDPIFFLVHSFLDKVWAEWMAVYGPDYPAFGAQFGHNRRDPMYLFGNTPESTLNHHKLGYWYDTEEKPTP